MRLSSHIRDLDDFRFGDFELADYEPHPHIAAEVAV
jgi:thymidylate synthase